MSSLKDRLKSDHLLRGINARQKIAILAPLVLVGVMVPVFRLLSGAFDRAIVGWYLGLVSYWLTWCTILPLWLVGKKRLGEIIGPQKPNITALLLVLFPAGMAALRRSRPEPPDPPPASSRNDGSYPRRSPPPSRSPGVRGGPGYLHPTCPPPCRFLPEGR